MGIRDIADVIADVIDTVLDVSPTSPLVLTVLIPDEIVEFKGVRPWPWPWLWLLLSDGQNAPV